MESISREPMNPMRIRNDPVEVFGTHLFKRTKWIVERSVEGDGVDLKRANAGLLEVVVHSTKSLEAKCSDLVRKLNLLQK